MRQLFGAALVIVAVGVLQAETPQEKTAQVKGLHLCCKSCEKSVQAILDKVDGVSEVKFDRKNKTVTFAAKNQEIAVKALDSLYSGGFAGSGSYGEIAFSPISKQTGDKTNEVKVKGVHACCGQCNGAIKAVFKDAKDTKVTITGKGAQKDVLITGTDLNPNAILNALNKAGFNGTIEAKK